MIHAFVLITAGFLLAVGTGMFYLAGFAHGSEDREAFEEPAPTPGTKKFFAAVGALLILSAAIILTL